MASNAALFVLRLLQKNRNNQADQKKIFLIIYLSQQKDKKTVIFRFKRGIMVPFKSANTRNQIYLSAMIVTVIVKQISFTALKFDSCQKYAKNIQ